MLTNNEYLRARALKNVRPSLKELRSREWSPEFEALMRHRLLQGGHRYGWLNAPDKPQYDRAEAIIKRAQEFQKSGNTELLVDIANFALCEFEEGIHPAKHFESGDDGEHVQIKGGLHDDADSDTRSADPD